MPDRPGTKSQICPQTILDLIERFDLHRETYQRATYNETQVRREFIDPFFKALGWDVDNESGHAEKSGDKQNQAKSGDAILIPCWNQGIRNPK